ncbi:dicarboxylate transporter/tellurite-resistance protein TehA [Dyella flava]|uniref:Dicarboxylate transporter/tellurite-resistance protein TehA n=2 Tax=Dyella flava TaxID=1920170 RepID=A0ABS2K0B0_9GAMM|nr:dicarboxylate transporter/tellurite-resistance protein TehA [Dyella flava]MBM7124539.1 dicarboxylate transporter/tellurite-resistance protein TehA [Dyella flava]
MPASFFGIVLGVVGLGSSWRVATRLWGLPSAIGECVMAVAASVWILLVAGYLSNWIRHRDAAMAEARHPIQCCFISLCPISTTLMGLVLLPYAHTLALLAWAAGSLGQLAFVVARAGGMWRGERDITNITPILLLPTVAGNLISSIVAGALGLHAFGMLFLGIGFFSWLVIDSIILFRLWTGPAMPAELRPTLGIELAPPVVSCMAYLANTQGHVDLFAQATWGYGLFQLLVLCRLLAWIMKQPLSPSYWAFSFGLTALSTGALQMTLRGEEGVIAALAMPIFIIVNAVIVVLALNTLWHLSKNGLPAGIDASPASR